MTGKHKTILIVDDDQEFLVLLSKILTGAGHQVLTAENPMEGRRLLIEKAPHLIITDLHMLPEDGFSFIRSIKENKKFDSIPIIVLSGLNDFSSVKKAIALGVTDYAIKPLQSPVLLRKLKKAMFNHDFVKWKAPKGDEPIVTGQFPAEILALGEVGYTLSGPFKLTSGKDIKIEFSKLEGMDLHTCQHRTNSQPKSGNSPGVFQNDVTFVGIKETSSSKIRQLIMKKGGK